MWRTTEELFEMRRWAEARRARPCREEGRGSLRLAIPGEPCEAREVGWDEFEATFRLTHAVFVYDDAPGATRCFVGPSEDAHAFLSAACGGASPAPP